MEKDNGFISRRTLLVGSAAAAAVAESLTHLVVAGWLNLFAGALNAGAFVGSGWSLNFLCAIGSGALGAWLIVLTPATRKAEAA